MNILHELWYGNIYPSERPIKKDSEYAQVLRKVVDEKENLLPSLSPELQKGIEKLLPRNWKRAPLVWELSNEKENNDELEIDRR